MVSHGTDQLPAAIKLGRGKDQWGVQAFLYGSLYGLYPDFPPTTLFKQKRAQIGTFNYQLPIVAVPQAE